MQVDHRRRRWHTGAPTQLRAQQLRQEQTIAEAKLWYYLRDRRLDGFKFRRQHPIERFVVDFCCPKHHLIVEIDGPIHQEQIEYDALSADALRAAGYVVVRYTNDAVQQRIDEVLADLRRALTSDDHTASSPSPAAAGEGG
jgi:5-methyltetrahydrofolate--homocysteine methyltransferase